MSRRREAGVGREPSEASPTATRWLAGNGVDLVRERRFAAKVQSALERVYRLDRVADIGDFVRGAKEGEREALLLRRAEDGAIEVSLQLPPLSARAGLDALCQLIEGVSHFVYVVERARAEREATHLELELQAEVDKWVVLMAGSPALDVGASSALRARLYEDVVFRDDVRTEAGERYRVANDTANRFVRRLERDYVGHARYGELRAELRRFFQVGQEEKLRLGRAA
jgi:hypothetical protein